MTSIGSVGVSCPYCDPSKTVTIPTAMKTINSIPASQSSVAILEAVRMITQKNLRGEKREPANKK